MLQIKPVSDLRNHFSEIEKIVNEGEPVFLTKNGYGSMVVLSMEAYAELTDHVELELDKADRVAEKTSYRVSHEDGFSMLRGKLNE